ncbi:U3-containing 90S pre-ribosomal complex subunit-domain containing protein [Tricladium varicosporioides]|nr:U3-containing 90S pre-ribosomal complex subunit-domain containing protein [Hymenoscyphus varicosporioides]
MSTEDQLQDPLLERITASPKVEPDVPTKPSVSKKRKRVGETISNSKQAPKKAKSKKGKAIEEDELDLDVGINNAFSHMDSQLLADYVGQRTKKYECDLSSIELEDKYIPASAIQDTKLWDRPRTLDNLPGFLEKFAGNSTKLWSASKKNGAPHTIIVTAAGLRAAEIARVMRKFQTKDAVVAKLFAKHIKLQDSIKFLKSSRTGIAVGTPTRLKDLMDDGALAVDRLERIIVDASHIDIKKRGILDMKETQVPLILWLGQTEFKEKYGAESKGIQLLFY